MTPCAVSPQSGAAERHLRRAEEQSRRKIVIGPRMNRSALGPLIRASARSDNTSRSIAIFYVLRFIANTSLVGIGSCLECADDGRNVGLAEPQRQRLTK